MRRRIVLFAALLFAAGFSTAALAESYTDGIDYYKSGQPERAKIILNKTLNDPTTYKAEAYYYLGESEFALGNKEAAKGYYDQGIASDANYPFNYIGLGKLLLQNTETHKEASSKFKQAVKLAKKANSVAGVNTDIARAYFEAGMPDYKKYLNDALKFDDRYAPAYVLQGDIFAKENNSGEAAGMYEMAHSFDSGCIEAYVKYALLHYPINPRFATSKLEELLSGHPSSAIAQRELAEAYFNAGRFNDAVSAYARYMANPNHFASDRSRYAALLYFDKKYEESLTLIEQALPEEPDNLILNRFAMYDNFALENFEQAADFGKAFMNNPANAKFLTSQDYMVYGGALKELDRPEEYVAALEAAVKADPSKPEIYKELSDAYGTAGQMLKSADAMSKYMEMIEDEVLTADFYSLGKIYYQAAHAAEAPEEKISLFQKADSLFAIVTERAPENYLGYFWRARANTGMDPETETGLAKPYYEKVITMLEAEGSTGSSIIEAYRYMGYYHYLKEYAENVQGYPETKKWWNKILAINPEDSIKDAMSQLE